MSKLPEISEHKIQDSILDLLRYQGYLCWRQNTGASPYINKYGQKRFIRFGQPGFSDIFAVQPGTGKIVCFEVKRPSTKNGASAAQLDFIQRIKDQGGIAAVVCSPEDVASILGIKGLL